MRRATMTYTGGPGNNFAGNGDDDTYAPFARTRWKRVGANKAVLASLQLAHAAMSPTVQATEGRRIASVSDVELKADLTAYKEAAFGAALEPADATPEPDTAIEQTDELVNTALEQSEPVAVVGTMEEVLAHVGDDADRAADALAHELANKNRVTLVDALTTIAGDNT
jgi:hypothetical protein